MLTELTTAANAQASKTNTSGKNAPNQSTASVVFSNPLYILTFTDPGGAAALSLTQQAQQAASSSLGSNPTNSNIFHQVQAATSILFDAPSSLSTYGGDSGTLASQFTITDLSTKKAWFFRIRTSFDGVVWNSWKILSYKGTKVNPNAVVLEAVNGGNYAGITLPGAQGVGFSVGVLPTGAAIQTAGGTTLADTIGMVGPSSYLNGNYPTIGISNDTIDAVGVVTLTWDGYTVPGWSGNVNFLTFGWIPGRAQNLTETVLADGGKWVTLTLSGGARVSIGSGVAANGATINVPTGFTAANTMGVVSPATTSEINGYLHGIRQSNMVAGVVTASFDGVSGTSPCLTVNWFAIAWETSLTPNLIAVAGGQYLSIPTPSGVLSIGVGQTHSGGIMPLPSIDHNYQQCIAFSTPGTNDSTGTGLTMHGVLVCAIDATRSTSVGTVTCLYTNGGPIWQGAANWFTIAWL